ncbi:MAG TPA: hypothetical protein VG297_04700 [Bryobacteraceae bacterium]|jgi:hypothetical protein|nr:hypothetical protein [Bryobacteraceae bacterium]
MKHLTEEDLILFYYNEPGLAVESRRHAADCAECQAAVESLRRTLDLCNEWTVPEPDAEFERSTWAGLAPAITSEPRRRWFVPPMWVAAAAAVVLMAGAFALGRMSKSGHPRTPEMAGLSNQARERILEISLADHLDRAGMLLTEISNSDDSNATRDFALDRGRAHDLVEEGRLLRQTLALRGGGATVGFLDDVERVLLEVANAPDAVSSREIEQVRERIGAGSLLFKVRIIEANLRTQGQKL